MKRKTGDSSTALWILKAVKGQKRYVFLLTLFQGILGVCAMGYAVFLKGLVNCAVARDREGLVFYCALLAGMVLMQFIVRGMGIYLDEYTRSRLENTLKKRLFRNLLYKDYAKVSATHTGDWMTRLTSDTALVAGSIVNILPGLTGTLVKLICAGALLFVYVPKLAVWILLGGGITVAATWGLRRRLKKLHSHVQGADSRLRVFLMERLGGMMVLRAFGKEQTSLDQGSARMAEHKAARMKRTRLLGAFHNGFNFMVNGLYILCAIYCAGGIFSGVMDYGTFTAVLQLVSQLHAPIGNITGYFTQYASMLASAERLMAAEAFREDASEPVSEDLSGFYRERFKALGLRGACFTYRDVEPEARHGVLKGLDLEIQKGEYVAFCGPSGCGKSTALKLLMCMYRLDAGEGYLCSTREELPLTGAWRGLFAYVPQGNQLMSGTVRDAVTFAAPESRQQDRQILRALKIACADFVEDLPQGLDTQLRERGAGLSEGQMQRIAIARAIFSDRPILLLDEATSALDEATEARLLKNLKEMTDKTVIIVTHRPAALEITDRVIQFHPVQE